MQHQNCLLLGTLQRDKADRRAGDRLANCLGIGRVVLLPLHKWLDIRLVELDALHGPVSQAHVPSNATWRMPPSLPAPEYLREEANHLRATKFAPKNDTSVRGNSMK